MEEDKDEKIMLNCNKATGHYGDSFPRPLLPTSSSPKGFLSCDRVSSFLSTRRQFLLILIALLVTSTSLNLALAEEDLTCQKGVSGFPGATFPRGDILLKEGDTLEVYCRLDPRKTTYNATFLKFRFTKANVSEHLMKTTVINETTALLQVERMNVSSPHLSCEIVPPGSGSIQVCQNEIDVGFPPMKVENFQCIAPHWRSLNCTWTKPYNPIPTSYEVQILQKMKTTGRVLSVIGCPNTTATPTSCIWGPRTEPFYRQNLSPILFRVNGTNVLNPRGSTWDFAVDHWSIVIPEAPSDLKIHKVSSTNATVTWTFKSFKDFQPGLAHQVTICIQDLTSLSSFDVPCNITNLNSAKSMDQLELIVPLEYAYVNYTVEIRMRSQKAKDELQFWSDPSVVVVTSEARVPDASPKVNIGSFELVPVSKKQRDIYVYWEEVPAILHNGPDFHYVFTVFEDEEEREIKPREITGSYAKFTGLGLHKSYQFQILAANAVGTASSASTVYVPRTNKPAPELPTAVSKLDFTNGSFLVSWNPVNSAVPIVSYTVFSCRSTKPRPYQCQGPVKWDVVSSSKQSKLYNFLPHDHIYQFAVSANTESMSSGMAWASCTLIHDKVPDKLKKVEKKFEDEKEIHIEWQLDCSYKPGVIDGFKISYCRVEREKSCINEKSEAVSGANVTTFNLKKLQPCSTYMVWVSIISSNGESQKSDPVYATTKPSAPTNPPEARVLKVTNTTALISIKPSYPLNGVVKQYKIKYKSLKTGESGVATFDTKAAEHVGPERCFDDGSLAKQTDVEITNLGSSSNYTFTVSVCTVKCSGESEPNYFTTDIGYMNLTQAPVLKVDGEDVVVVWNVPQVSKEQVKYFEVRTIQNGYEQGIEPIDFEEETFDYIKIVKFSCKTDTNFSAQVRAVTEVGGNQLYGAWSPPGNFSCAGGPLWMLWVFGAVILVIFAVVTIIFIFNKLYIAYLKDKGLDIVVPPGIEQTMNGFSHGHTKRRNNSEGDTQSFGKENLSYQLQMTTTHHSSDDSKDFASLESCLQEQKETGVIVGGGEMEMRYVNKVYMEELESPPKSGGLEIGPAEPLNTPIITEALNVENESLIPKRPFPSSPTKALLDDSLTTEDDDTLQSLKEGYRNVNVKDLFTEIADEHARRSENVATSPSLLTNNNGVAVENIHRAPDVLPPSNHVPSTPMNGSPFIPSPPVLSNNSSLGPTNHSSYVKWTQMMPEELLNGDTTSLGLVNSRKTPYCQVGILLDST